MPSTPKGLSDEKAARVLVAFREGRTLRQFAMRAGRFDAYCKAHPEYAREALPLLEETETGLFVTIRGSKTDQERQGVTIAIARGDIACPVKALRARRGAVQGSCGGRVALSNPVHGVDHSSDVSQTSHHIRKVPDSDSRIYSAETSVGPLRRLKVAGGATPGSSA